MRENRETNRIGLWIPIPCAGEVSFDTRRPHYGVVRHPLLQPSSKSEEGRKEGKVKLVTQTLKPKPKQIVSYDYESLSGHVMYRKFTTNPTYLTQPPNCPSPKLELKFEPQINFNKSNQILSTSLTLFNQI